MADFQVDGPEIKKLVKVMRREPISFAFNPSDRDEDSYFGLHRLKAPQVLGREAKEEGNGGKFAFGTARVEGKVLILICERVIPSLAKKLKKFLKFQKVMLNVQVMDADGNILESDIEELPDDPEMDEVENGDAQAAAPKGRVSKRVFLIERWKKIPGELNVQIGVLSQQVAAKVPTEDPADFCKGVEEWFGQMILDMQGELDDAIDASINADDDRYAAVVQLIRSKLEPRVANDRLVTLFRKGNLLQGSPFEDAFRSAFREMEAALSA